jgi:hypothetical protein
MSEEKRELPRESIGLRVRLGDGRVGVTRDISASGMFLEFEGPPPVSGTIMFEMEVPASRLKFVAQGWIVRIEQKEGRTGVAVKLIDPMLAPIG